jgi:predicted DNA-binding transcriptional regulator AlpA
MHQSNQTTALEILRRKQVAERVGVSGSTIYGLVLRGEFPQPFALTGQRALGWLASDVDDWIRARAARVPLGLAAELQSKVHTGARA